MSNDEVTSEVMAPNKQTKKKKKKTKPLAIPHIKKVS